MPFELPPGLAERIAELPLLRIAQLRALWRETFQREPLIASRRFMERRIAYRWQSTEFEKAYPGVLAAQRERIATLAAALDAAKKPAGNGVRPGTVLIRAFNGAEHEVRVADGVDGLVFEYLGQRYRSLSEVARKITGTRWSGPLFFGLRQRRKAGRK